MTYSVEFTPEATVELEALSPTIQERIWRKVHWLSDNFTPNALLNSWRKCQSSSFKCQFEWPFQTQSRWLQSYLFFCNPRTAAHNPQSWTSPIYLQLIQKCDLLRSAFGSTSPVGWVDARKPNFISCYFLTWLVGLASFRARSPLWRIIKKQRLSHKV